MNEEKIYCSHCGEIIESDDYDTIYGEPVCEDCVDRYTTIIHNLTTHKLDFLL